MKILKVLLLAASTVFSLHALPAKAQAPRDSVVGAGGYDLTSYFSQEKPQRGNGHHTAVVNGVTYLFASEDNKKALEANPSTFLPQYGGYCAFGVSIGSRRIAGMAREVPPEPRAEMIQPTSRRDRIKRSNASAIADTDFPRSLLKTVPVPFGWNRATSCGPTSAADGIWLVERSTVMVRIPSFCRQLARKPSSRPLVSKVPHT